MVCLAWLMYPLSEARNLASAGSARLAAQLKQNPMAYAQIRVRRLDNSNLASTEKHNARLFSPEECPDNIDKSKTMENRMLFARDEWADENLSMQEMVERRLNELNVKGIKKNSTKAIEVVVSVSDGYFFHNPKNGFGYSPMGYGINEMNWLEDKYFGKGNVVCGYLHMEETKPHWHFICIPVKEKEVAYKNRYGSGKKMEMRLCANDIIHGYMKVKVEGSDKEVEVHKLSNMQQQYYEHCRDTYGHIMEFWRGLKAEDQKRKYVQKTDYEMAKLREQKRFIEEHELVTERIEKEQNFDAQIERQNKSRKSESYQWDKNAEVPEWSWGKRGR